MRVYGLLVSGYAKIAVRGLDESGAYWFNLVIGKLVGTLFISVCLVS